VHQVEIVGAPVTCKDGIKETWREHVINRAKPEFILAKIASEEGVKTYPEVFAILEKQD